MNKRWFIASVVSMLILVVALTGFALAERPGSTPPGLARAIAAQEAHTDALLERPGVVGTAVGLDNHGTPVVKIYTASGHVSGLPHSLDGVATEVELTGELVAHNVVANTGVSTGTERLIVYHGSLYCTVGTLGAIVSNSNGIYALSNAHVYALQGSQPYGGAVSNSDRMLQPGRVDMTAQACGSTSEINVAVIGTLASYVPIEMSRKANNTVDAAIALLTTAPLGTETPCGYTPATATAVASMNQLVKKCGRTTGLTTGKVSGVNATVVISYDKGQARFVGQIVVKGDNVSFSNAGDSGSLVVTQSGNNPVALLFAGSPSTTIGNPIGAVLSAFGVTVNSP